jgi:hypothetical protein
VGDRAHEDDDRERQELLEEVLVRSQAAVHQGFILLGSEGRTKSSDLPANVVTLTPTI